jgi:dihydrodipicolinate synthase/N-acetylneuraminate lyase
MYGMEISKLNAPPDILSAIRQGLVIPAHPLALNSRRQFDEKRMSALTRYYIDSGAGGLAVGVHTTQFEIRDPGIDLYKPVLENVADTVKSWEHDKPVALIAGICGQTKQAANEAETAIELGYHAGLLSLGAFRDATDDELIEHCSAVAKIIPVFSFYLQPAVGGRNLSFHFWKRFTEIENVIAIKIAPFDRYKTLDVARAVAESGRASEIALYTGNDDNIVADLLTPFTFGEVTARIVGGLLGQWAVWTKAAVNLFKEIKDVVDNNSPIPQSLITKGVQLTDANAAIFDASNNFAGCIPGIHEILTKQGLLKGRWCLDENLDLSPSQADEIDRVCKAYPHLTDDDFVAQHLYEWLG